MPSRRRRCLSQQDLRALGVRPGLVATRYTPNGERAEIRQLTAEALEAALELNDRRYAR